MLYKRQDELVVELKKMREHIRDALGQEMEGIAKRLLLEKDFAYCIAPEGALQICYNAVKSEDINKGITTKLIEDFNKDLTELRRQAVSQIQGKNPDLAKIKQDYQAGAINLIARLYAGLEWVHPWIDGQGRTDLIMLNGLLSREGIHPSILNRPYYSTFHKVSDWVQYLKQGLDRYSEVYTESQITK